MKRKLFLCLGLLALMVPALAQAAEKVFFATDMSDLSLVEQKTVAAVAEKAKQTGAVVVIVGNADKRGPRLYNFDLGMRRAQTVSEALLAAGVPAEQIIITLSQGKEKPWAPADNIPGHLQANRRVDVVLVEAKVKTVVVRVPVEVVREVQTYRKNRVTLLGGFGPMGLDKHTLSLSNYKVTQDQAPVFGLGYSRSLNSRFSLGVTALSNMTFLFNVGLDF